MLPNQKKHKIVINNYNIFQLIISCFLDRHKLVIVGSKYYFYALFRKIRITK